MIRQYHLRHRGACGKCIQSFAETKRVDGIFYSRAIVRKKLTQAMSTAKFSS